MNEMMKRRDKNTQLESVAEETEFIEIDLKDSLVNIEDCIVASTESIFFDRPSESVTEAAEMDLSAILSEATAAALAAELVSSDDDSLDATATTTISGIEEIKLYESLPSLLMKIAASDATLPSTTIAEESEFGLFSSRTAHIDSDNVKIAPFVRSHITPHLVESHFATFPPLVVIGKESASMVEEDANDSVLATELIERKFGLFPPESDQDEAKPIDLKFASFPSLLPTFLESERILSDLEEKENFVERDLETISLNGLSQEPPRRPSMNLQYEELEIHQEYDQGDEGQRNNRELAKIGGWWKSIFCAL